MLEHRELRAALQGATAISTEVMEHVYNERWLQLWVPKEYGGLGCDFKTGLTHLYQWAQLDGSLGWMLTLCAGANYFARNIQPETAKRLFSDSRTCFGGSGMVGGTADQQEDGSFIVNGCWHYATGAPYLSHFTLNAKVLKQGRACLDEEGNPRVHSFIVEQGKVRIIPNWKSMGMRATGTFSFEVDQVRIPEAHHFVYDTFYTDDPVARIPFRLFADLTLLVNYLGVAHHFMEEAQKSWNHPSIRVKQQQIEAEVKRTLDYAQRTEALLAAEKEVTTALVEEIHAFGVAVVDQLIQDITGVYVQLGIKGTQTDQPIYQVFCDFFTATQHANFRREEERASI